MSGRSVPRIGRILDLAGLLLFTAGGGLGLWAWSGFRRVADVRPTPDDALGAAVRLADEYWRLQKIGVGLMTAGIVVFVFAWWVARRVRAKGDGR